MRVATYISAAVVALGLSTGLAIAQTGQNGSEKGPISHPTAATSVPSTLPDGTKSEPSPNTVKMDKQTDKPANPPQK
jgi:hypothetical protein